MNPTELYAGHKFDEEREKLGLGQKEIDDRLKKLLENLPREERERLTEGLSEGLSETTVRRI
jgi:hypothetical protein